MTLGVLAAPSGYKMTGFAFATLLIIVFGMINAYSVHLQTRMKLSFGNKVKTYTDLGTVCYGTTGTVTVALVILLN